MNRLRVLARLAWRDAVRHKGRSLLIMAMVGLPVLVAGGADVLFRSTETPPEQVVAENLADASAFLYAPQGAGWVSQPTDVMSASWPGTFFATNPLPGKPVTGGAVLSPRAADGTTEAINPFLTPIRPPGQVLPLLPEGSLITLWQHGTVPISGDGPLYRPVTADLLDLTSPAAGDRYRLTAGQVADERGEIALTPELAETLGVDVGDTVSTGAPAADRQVVGLVTATVTGSRPVTAVVAPPNSIPGLQLWGGLGAPRYLVASPEPITPAMVRTLNSEGIQVFSRAAVLVTPSPGVASTDDAAMIGFAAGILLIGLGLMQVVFLSGPAFAIAARRLRRQLGLAAATGASPAHVAGVVLAGGLLLGVLASVLGTAFGAVLAVAVMPLLTRWFDFDFPTVAIRPGELLLIAGIGATTSLLAAAWPAVGAHRMSPIAALSRRAKPPKRPGLVSMAGLVVAFLGVAAVAWAGSGSLADGADKVALVSQRMPWLVGGIAAIQLGLIVGTPQLVAGFGVLQRILPTGSRLALRSAARHRGRSTGAVATVLVATVGGVLGAVLIATTEAQLADSYQPSLRHGQVIGVAHGDHLPFGAAASAPAPPRDPAAVAGLATRMWPDAKVATFSRVRPSGDLGDPGEVRPVTPPVNQCPWFSPGSGPYSIDSNEARRAPTVAELPSARVDARCVDMGFSTLTPEQAHSVSGFSGPVPQLMIGTAELRRILTGVPDPDADAALARGEVVVLDQRYLGPDGRFTMATERGDDQGHRITSGQSSVPAVLGRWAPTSVAAIIPPAAAAGLGVQPGHAGFVTEPLPNSDRGTSRGITLEATSRALGVQMVTYTEAGPGWSRDTPPVWLILLAAAVLILGVVLVTTALGVVDADDDSAIYAAVGATPRLRRILSGWSALLTTGLGCVFGAAAGLVAAWGIYRMLKVVNSIDVGMVIPWGQLALLLIGVPVVAFALAALFTRSKIQLIRRIE